ncbi:SAM-dependent methyltransferase [Bradyrhizobium sp. i1.8.4]|uniref:class I SAM-dependent DNA methyltransferase n=1 Tax=unclassified Bradyrhizobium TaxID=2631580 RepID=UPI003D1F1D75
MARIINHYLRHAHAWDADRSTAGRNDKPCHDRFIAALPGSARVLDLGCGPGFPAARHMAECGLRVTGVDSSPTFMALCRQRLPEHEFLVGEVRSLELARQFDGVLAWDSFFHPAPDEQRRMFDVFARHAGPSAVLIFNSGPRFGESIGQYRGDPLYHASLGPDEYTALLDGIGFDVIAHVVEDWATAGGRTVWLARSRLHGMA